MTDPKNTPEKSYLEGLTKAELIEHIKSHSVAMDMATNSAQIAVKRHILERWMLDLDGLREIRRTFELFNSLNSSLSGMTADEAMQYFDENSECLKKMLNAAKP